MNFKHSIFYKCELTIRFWSAVIPLIQHKVKILHQYLGFKGDKIGSAKITEEPARDKGFCQKKMSNLEFKFWRDSLQTSVQICHESVAISVKVNRESDFCQPFICISFFFFELVHPVLWLRLMHGIYSCGVFSLDL